MLCRELRELLLVGGAQFVELGAACVEFLPRLVGAGGELGVVRGVAFGEPGSEFVA